MKARPGVRSEPALLVSFDGGVRERVVCHRPDRYRLLETDVDARPRIYRVGEVGIQTFPRTFGQGSSTSVRNILATIADTRRIYRKTFSEGYDLPPRRPLPRTAGVQAQVGWCERGELNPHGLPLWILSPARLPIPPLSHDRSIAIPAAKHVEGGSGQVRITQGAKPPSR